MIQFVLKKRGANPMGNVAMLYFFLLATVQHLFLATMLLLSAPWFITALVFYWSLIYRREDKYPGSTPDIDLAFHYRISETGNQKSNRNRVPAGHTKFTLFDSQSTGGDTRGGFSWPIVSPADEARTTCWNRGSKSCISPLLVKGLVLLFPWFMWAICSLL